MTSTLQTNKICRWLIDRLSNPAVSGIWIYGSFLSSPATANDVDVMLRYENGRMNEALVLRRRVDSDFRKKFGIPLHLVLLSTREFEEEVKRVGRILTAAQRLR